MIIKKNIRIVSLSKYKIQNNEQSLDAKYSVNEAST